MTQCIDSAVFAATVAATVAPMIAPCIHTSDTIHTTVCYHSCDVILSLYTTQSVINGQTSNHFGLLYVCV